MVDDTPSNITDTKFLQQGSKKRKSQKRISKRKSVKRKTKREEKTKSITSTTAAATTAATSMKKNNFSKLVVVKTPTHTVRGIEKGNIKVEYKDGFISIDKGAYGRTIWEFKKLKLQDRPIIAKDDQKKILKIGSNSIEFNKRDEYAAAVECVYSYRKKRT